MNKANALFWYFLGEFSTALILIQLLPCWRNIHLQSPMLISGCSTNCGIRRMDCRQCLDQKIDSNLAIRWPIQCLDLVDNKLDIANMCQLCSVTIVWPIQKIDGNSANSWDRKDTMRKCISLLGPTSILLFLSACHLYRFLLIGWLTAGLIVHLTLGPCPVSSENADRLTCTKVATNMYRQTQIPAKSKFNLQLAENL